MKSSSMDTHMGSITINKEVIAQYAGNVAMECFGIVGMAGINVKDGFVKLLKMDNLTRGIYVSLNNDKLILDFHIIIAYGVNIRTLSNNLIESVKYKVEEFTGIEVDKINIYVEGVRVID
ncbi:MAG: Asp23/Gls24 family envelope stress response protein [Lachnospiraceae bacterium]|nr:Asp23/Gls24 family envelope stress response protein [Lachnospiraceae bacterium]